MIKIEVVKRLLKKETKNKPMLQCINYTKKYITFVDGYILVSVRNYEPEFTPDQPVNINVFTGRIQGGTFPNIEAILTALPRDSKPFEPEELIEIDKELYYKIDDFIYNKKTIEDVLKSIGLKYDDNIKKDLRVNKGRLFINNDDTRVLIMGLKNNGTN